MHPSRAQIVTANVQAFLMRLQVLLYSEQIPPEQYEGLTHELSASVVVAFSDLITHVIDGEIPLLNHWS